MSPSTESRELGHEPHRREPDRADSGFTLIEIIVALGIITVVMSALLPQLVVGIKSTSTSRLITQAKGVAQGQLERMRNLPYHVAKDSGDFLDVLDYYYTNRTAPAVAATCTSSGGYRPPLTSWTGYVGSTNTARCDYEPATGAMYRTVSAPQNGFTVVVTTQFLSGATPPLPVSPPSGYNTQSTGNDSPAAMQIGVTVTVLYSDRQTLRPVSTYTRIADQPTAPDQIKVSADATVVEVGSETASDGAVTLDSGILHLTGALTYASTAGATIATTSGGVASGAQGGGTSTTLAVPPVVTAGSTMSPPGDLTSGCGLVCWGSTRLDNGGVTSQNGLPNVGSWSAPMQSLVTDKVNNGLGFDNGPASSRRTDLALAAGPLLRLQDTATATPSGLTNSCGAGATGTSSYVTASGYVRSTAVKDPVAPAVVESCARARASTIALFPTTFAPQGVVQIELQAAQARCVVNGVGHVPAGSSDYLAQVRYHLPDGPDSYSGWKVISPSSPDPLDSINLATTLVGDGHYLGDYVDSWSGLTQAEVEKTTGTGSVAVNLPGVVTLISQPVRVGSTPLTVTASPSTTPSASPSPSPSAGPTATDSSSPSASPSPSMSASPSPTAIGVDLTSALSLTLGVTSCSAKDAR
ncbi:prepilin-type N-terminal cleavage/methylation domain-containing protein [Nocardioides sp. MAHUQ-72]|uniref:prepilin-type N-terminal cleavage/methylation domain-containing protein n=1 Tax=unclassified Nocardioides TaxID=2615069 RepID=UPI003621596E